MVIKVPQLSNEMEEISSRCYKALSKSRDATTLSSDSNYFKVLQLVESFKAAVR